MTALRALSLITICSQPDTQGLPMPRATTAACEVLPPRLVRMPCAWKKPWMSSGLVSSRTRMTFSPAWPRASAVLASNTILPEAAPGEAGSPCARDLPWKFGDSCGTSNCSSMGGLDAQQRALLGNQPFVEHFHRGAHHGAGVHLAVAGLQAVERALLDGELEILHFVVMRLQPVVQFDQLAVDLRHFLFHLGDRLGRADARHHVLALGIDQIFAVDHVLAGAGIAREAHAGAGIVAHVAEHHGADVDRGAVGHVLGDLELLAVVHRALAHPGTKHRAHRDFELLVGVLRKWLAGVALDDVQELAGEFLQLFGGKVQVQARAVLALERRHLASSKCSSPMPSAILPKSWMKRR